MSYESENRLGSNATLTSVRELITLLGYTKLGSSKKNGFFLEEYFWFDDVDYHSYVGVELQIHRKQNEPILVTTRSRVLRSYWDVHHQNKTIKCLRDFLGGTFTTDAGVGRYKRSSDPPHEPIASACYVARWILHNAFVKVKFYLKQREISSHDDVLTGIDEIDEMNPMLFSNNLAIPYLFAIWEQFFKAVYVAMFKYSDRKMQVLKQSKMPYRYLELIAEGFSSIEVAVAETMSFQRPSVITKNFSVLNPSLSIASVLKRPYRGRKQSLFDKIELLVEQRNDFVHVGAMSAQFREEDLLTILEDFRVSVDRCYDEFGRVFNFKPLRNY